MTAGLKGSVCNCFLQQEIGHIQESFFPLRTLRCLFQERPFNKDFYELKMQFRAYSRSNMGIFSLSEPKHLDRVEKSILDKQKNDENQK